MHHGTSADIVVAKSVAIESPKQITVSKMLLNLLQDTACFLLLLHWDGKMLHDMQQIIKTPLFP